VMKFEVINVHGNLVRRWKATMIRLIRYSVLKEVTVRTYDDALASN